MRQNVWLSSYVVGLFDRPHFSTILLLKAILQQTFINEKVSLIHKNRKMVFLSHPLRDLRVMYVHHLYLIGKRMIDFPQILTDSSYS